MLTHKGLFGGPARKSRLITLIETWLDLSRERRALAALDDRMLKDIGLNRASAAQEARRPFWDVPEERKPAAPVQDIREQSCAPECCTDAARANA